MWYLAPYVHSPKLKTNRPVYEVYEDVLKWIKLTKTKDGGKYAKRILGTNEVKYAPSEYYDWGIAIELGLTQEWSDMNILVKAQLLARVYLKGMVGVVEAHRDAQKEIIEKATGGG